MVGVRKPSSAIRPGHCQSVQAFSSPTMNSKVERRMHHSYVGSSSRVIGFMPEATSWRLMFRRAWRYSKRVSPVETSLFPPSSCSSMAELGSFFGLSSRLNLDLGASYGYDRLGGGTLTSKASGSATRIPATSGSNAVIRLGLAMGLRD